METSLNPTASASRSRSRGLVLAGGILFVIGFGGPSLLLTAGLVRVTAAYASQA
jgi:hypothetical protein